MKKFKLIISSVLVVSIVCLSGLSASALTIKDLTPNDVISFKPLLQTFDVVSKDTETGIESIQQYDTSLTTNALKLGISEISTPAYAGSDPSMPEMTTQSIIGKDDRVRISNPSSQHPYRAICRIVTYWDKNKDGKIDSTVGVATGFLEGPSAVVSNGHVIYDANLKMWCKYAEVTFAQDGSGSAPYGTIRSTTIHTSSAWINSGDFNQDWSVIEIASPIGNRTGWFGKMWTSGTLNNTSVNLTGYPGDKPQTMWRSPGKIVNTHSAWVDFDCDMVSGSSGSPIYNSSNQIVAINSAEGGALNGGVRITEWLYNFIDQFRPR